MKSMLNVLITWMMSQMTRLFYLPYNYLLFGRFLYLKFIKISIFSFISEEGCNIDDSEDGDEDEDVHVCGSCKSAFGNVGKQNY